MAKQDCQFFVKSFLKKLEIILYLQNRLSLRLCQKAEGEKRSRADKGLLLFLNVISPKNLLNAVCVLLYFFS